MSVRAIVDTFEGGLCLFGDLAPMTLRKVHSKGFLTLDRLIIIMEKAICPFSTRSVATCILGLDRMLGLRLGEFGARGRKANMVLWPALRSRCTKTVCCTGLVLGLGSAEIAVHSDR